MCVIELAKKGQEATTFELIITVANTASTLGSILAIQVLTPLNTAGCTNDDGCPSNTVDINNADAYNDSDGPWRFTRYALVLASISICGCLTFTPFLPSSKIECHEWKDVGEAKGDSKNRGIAASVLAVLTVCVSALPFFFPCVMSDSLLILMTFSKLIFLWCLSCLLVLLVGYDVIVILLVTIFCCCL